MEVGMSRIKLLVGAALAAAISGGVVLATPGSGTQSTLLGRSRYEAFDVTRRVKAPKEPGANTKAAHHTDQADLLGRTIWKVKAEAEPALDIATQMITFDPGGQSGWHTHPGPVFISVIEGTMTFYEGDDPDCQPMVLHAGEGFVDGQTDRHAHIARNETALPAKNLVTYFAPPGAVLRVDAPNPGNCPF
jgi:quercetin dioxygenase-like cupin family protein